MGGKLTSCLLVLFILLLVVIGGCTKAEEEITLIIPGTAVELKMRLIPSGNFVMGTPEKEADRERNEVQHQVTITKSFYLSIYEVTQEQWKSVMGTNPSRFGNNAKFQ